MKYLTLYLLLSLCTLFCLDLSAQDLSDINKMKILIKGNYCDYDNPEPFFKRCDSIYSLCEELNYDEGKLLCIQQKCNARLAFGNFSKEDYLKGIELAKKLNNYGIHASLLAMASYTKVDLGLYKEADRDLQEALVLAEKVAKEQKFAVRRYVYNGLGYLSQKSKAPFETIEHFSILAYRDAKLMDDKDATKKAYVLLETVNLAELYAFDKKNYASAKKFIDEAVAICILSKRKDNSLVQFNRVQGIYYYKVKEYDKSIYYLNKSLQYSKNDYLNIDSYEALATIYTAKNDLKKAAEYLQKFNSLKSKVSDQEKKLLQDIYENKISDENGVFESKNWIFFLGLLLLIGLVGVYLYKIKFKSNTSVTDYSNTIMEPTMVKDNHSSRPVNLMIVDETDTKFEELYNQILKHFDADFPYRDENYNMSALATKLNTNTAYVSKAINKNTGTNFKNFINKYRIEEIKKRLQQNEHKNYTFQHIYKSNGFSNQTTFNRAFKEIEGITPNKYIESLKGNL